MNVCQDEHHDQRAIDALRRDCATYRALAFAALDTLAEAYARTAMLERQLSEARAELRRITTAVFPQIVSEAQE